MGKKKTRTDYAVSSDNALEALRASMLIFTTNEVSSRVRHEDRFRIDLAFKNLNHVETEIKILRKIAEGSKE